MQVDTALVRLAVDLDMEVARSSCCDPMPQGEGAAAADLWASQPRRNWDIAAPL